MPKFRRSLGQAIRNRRKALRLSQEQLAERLDMHRNYISLVERGIQNITVETLFKLSLVLDCTPTALLAETESLATTLAQPGPPASSGTYLLPGQPVWRVAETDNRP